MAKGRQMPDYTKYVKAYNNKKAALAKKGYTMYDSQMYSPAEYRTIYQATLNTQKKQVAEGKRGRTGMVIRDMVNDQAYQFTREQARAQQKAAKQLGVKANLQDIMTGSTQLGDLLKDEEKVLRDAGLSEKEIRLTISQEYFGSL